MSSKAAAKSKRVRGKGVKPAMAIVSLRIPQDTLAYYKELGSHTVEMRRVLDNAAGVSHGKK